MFLCIIQSLPAQTNDSILHMQLNKKNIEFIRYKKLGDTFYDNGYVTKAIESYQKALQFKKDNNLQKKLAKAWNRKGYITKAIAIYRSILEVDSTNVNIRYNLGILLAKKGKIRQAKKLFYELEKYDKNNPDYSYQLGQLEQDINKKLDAYLRSYHKDSTLIKSIYKITQLYRLLSNYKDSVDYFMDKGLQLSPNHFGLLRFKVVDLYRDKRYTKMAKLLLKLDSIYPQKLFIKKNLGLAYLQLNKLEKSEINLKKAKKIEEEPIIYYYLGLLYFKQKKYKQAKMMNLIAINKKKVKNNKEYYQLGLIEKEQKHIKKALDFFYKAYKENAHDHHSMFEWVILSDVYYKDKKDVINRYKKYLSRFENRDVQETKIIRKRLLELKTELFMKE